MLSHYLLKFSWLHLLVSIDWFKRGVAQSYAPWKLSTMVDVAVAIVLRLGVKRQKRFQLSSARTALSSRPPPLFRAEVLSRWLFPALMERLFSAHKMKWISAPEPEIGRRRQLCHPLPIFSCRALYRRLFPAIFDGPLCGRIPPVPLESASQVCSSLLQSLEQILWQSELISESRTVLKF